MTYVLSSMKINSSEFFCKAFLALDVRFALVVRFALLACFVLVVMFEDFLELLRLFLGTILTKKYTSFDLELLRPILISSSSLLMTIDSDISPLSVTKDLLTAYSLSEAMAFFIFFNRSGLFLNVTDRVI